MLETRLAGNLLQLYPGGAVYLPGFQTLLVADAHFGKAVSFRRLGVPVPQGTTTENLDQLSALVAETGARRLVFLGDFLHSARAHATSTQAALARWRARHPDLHLVLVRGNHDDRAGDPPAALGFEVVDEPLMLGEGAQQLALCHYPEPVAGAYVLAGHWHPCVSLSGRAHDRLRLRCFWFGDAAVHAVGVLPAFGSFTGMHPIERRPGDRVFAVAGEDIREVPSPASAPRVDASLSSFVSPLPIRKATP
jgi:uncharacterized protein